VLVSTIGAFRLGDALTTVPETLRLMLDVNLGTRAVAEPGIRTPHAAAGLNIEPPHARDPGERGGAAAARYPANRATFPAEVMRHAVAPEALAGVIAFLVSDAAATVSGAILPADGA
jgi:NAD(P)-dependent dehydrogenase (short-subunit alcohol dehydrogenase family)